MTSIFDLKTNVQELDSANEGSSKMMYSQVAPTRDVVGKNFSNGSIHFKFENSGTEWFLPSRTYLRTRLRLTKGDGSTPIDLSSGIAPNMGIMSNSLQSCEFRIADKTVSRVSDFVPQVDSLDTRLSKSSSWLDSIGNSTNFWQTKQNIRMSEVSSDGAFINDRLPSVAPETTLTPAAQGFVSTNTVAYVAATGLVTFAGANGPANINTAFQVNDILTFSATGDGTGIVNVGLKVLSLTGAKTMLVEPIGPTDITAAVIATNVFSTVRPGTAPVVSTPSRRVGEFETCYIPPLSIFKVEHALPSGKYELVLNPATAISFQQRCIESVLGSASKTPSLDGGVAQDYKVEIVSMFLYVATIQGPRTDNTTYLLDLQQTRCQSEKINNRNFGQRNFDVSPSTYGLTVAYQDLRCGVNTAISSSKFRSYESGSTPSVSQELNLNRFYINYAGQNLPSPDADPDFVPYDSSSPTQSGIDYTTQRYMETQLYSGAYFDSGGSETIEEWHERGSYYYFSVPKDGSDRSTRVTVNQQFTGGDGTADITNMRVLCFDHSRQVARIQVENGRVISVQLEDA